ncbi:MAG TPA: bifunctional serine/threonine-protein kinase/formylglycine-generating enzyme family protein [Polyangiaceae bacterium]|nr:bifunctional serine/threonine-protein kinase/formylglycine-generating enzyme family protein [Polyangiaceae bacterium]
MTQRDPLNIAGLMIADKYRIERLVGEGGFAVVYRAQHTIWNKPVAIKFFNGLSSAPVDQRDQFQQAFIQEGALLTELSSQTAGIVQARDIGTYTSPDGQWMPYMVLEWLEGSALDELMERERSSGEPNWNLKEVVALLTQVCSALDVAHGKGIAHRDIKPANLFVLGSNPRGGGCTVKILDFGVAKMMSDNTQLKAALAKTGMSVTSFTPQYGAPEQFSRSYGATGPWTDVFALALVGIELLIGKPALDGADIVQLGFASGNPQKRPTPRELGANLPDAVELVFEKALAVTPQERFARAREFADALNAALSGGVGQTVIAAPASRAATPIAATELAPAVRGGTFSTSTPSTVTTQGGPAAGKSKAGLVIGALLGVAALAAIGAFSLRKSPPPAPSSESAVSPPPAQVSAAAAAPASAAAAPSCPARTVLIPAGQFFQGSDAKDAPANEKPAHNVSLDSFCMDLYEVTAREYRACSDVGKCKRAGTEVEWPNMTPADKKTYSPLCTISDPSKSDHPINCISWDMASTYCKAQDKRLPTEAEWEYATRGPDGRVYPWGDEAPTAKHLNACGSECVAWGKQNHADVQQLYPDDDGYATTAPVGKYEAGRSRFGPYDVVGNVGEWVGDWWGDYSPVDRKNPTGPEAGQKRVIRGGAWNAGVAVWLHPSFRYAQEPSALSHGIGFRCAKPLTP